MQGTTFVEESDVTMQVEGDQIILRAGKTLEQLTSISLLGFYNPETVQWDDDAIQSDYPLSTALGDPGEVTIIYTFPVPVTLRPGSELLRITVNGDPHEVTFSDVMAVFADDTQESLAVGISS